MKQFWCFGFRRHGSSGRSDVQLMSACMLFPLCSTVRFVVTSKEGRAVGNNVVCPGASYTVQVSNN
jgi:hypothetical protein